MSAIPVSDALMTEEEYLAWEERNFDRHEFLAGVPHAMAGGRSEHSTISTNIIGALHFRLRGKRCQPFGSDMKVRVEIAQGVYYYYPDATVVCDPAGVVPGRVWTDKPSVIFEVLSDSTRRVDEGEKALMYWKLPSLAAYVLVEQDKVRVTIRRRDGGGEVLTGRDTPLVLPELGLEIPIGEFFERLNLPE